MVKKYSLRERAEMKYKLLDFVRNHRTKHGAYPTRREIYEAGHRPALDMHYGGSAKRAVSYSANALPLSVWQKRIDRFLSYLKANPLATYETSADNGHKRVMFTIYRGNITEAKRDAGFEMKSMSVVPLDLRRQEEEKLIEYVRKNPDKTFEELQDEGYGSVINRLGSMQSVRRLAGVPIELSLWPRRLKELRDSAYEADEMISSPSLLKLLYVIGDANPGDRIDASEYREEIEKIREALRHLGRRGYERNVYILSKYFGISHEDNHIVLREPKTLEAVGKKYRITRECTRQRKDNLIERAKRGYYEASLIPRPERRNARVSCLDLSERSRRTLRRMRIHTVAQLADRLRTDKDSFAGKKQFGRASMREVERKARAFGY
jgi:hypothetical protein